MGVCRVLGLVGSASCLALLCYGLVDGGIPNKPIEWFVAVSVALLGFNFVPVSKSKDSLIGLWIEAKKAKLRKEIEE